MKAREIYDLLGRKREAFKGFLSVTRSLSECSDSEENNGEKIASCIEERQRCITMINRIDDRIRRVRSEDPFVISGLSKDAREKLAERAAVIGDIAAQAMQINKECEATLTRRRDELKGQIDAVHRSRHSTPSRARKAYRADQPKFLDITL